MYTTKQAMIDRYGEEELIQLTDRTNPPAGMIDDIVIDAAIADAEAEIDGYLQSRYALPLASVPLLVSHLARDIARYNLYDDLPPEHISDRYKAAVKTLESISKGVIHLGLDASQQSAAQTAMPETSADAAVFSPDTMGGFW